MSIFDKVNDFRTLLNEAGVQAYIFPSSDPHQSEYVAEHWASRAWISGFTGSAGSAVLSLENAGVWTDSRYFLQAEQELKQGPFELHKVYNRQSKNFIDWLLDEMSEGQSVGCDGRLFSRKMLSSYDRRLAEKGIKLLPNLDLVSKAWLDRHALPDSPIFDYDVTYAAESRGSKLKRTRAVMKKWQCKYHLLSTLDDIAWTLNFRGSDVDFNPVAYSYLLVTSTDATLYIDESKVDTLLKQRFQEEGISIRSYTQVWEDLNLLPTESSILIDETTISYSMYRAINSKHKVTKTLPAIKFKAIKNEVEIQHIRNVMEKDGIALLRFYMWLEENIDKKPSEFLLAQKIAEYRSSQLAYVSESFSAIVGYRGNGAIVHYRPTEDDSAEIGKSGLLLIDSGGQYLDGTTDITRTTCLGDPSDLECEAYTRVLKGHIALDSAIFPEGTLGVQLDTLARIHLWHNKMNFLHGTGHGIGFFLNVHEGPQGFYPGVAARGATSIDEHMVTTNEPGYYEDGKFGIRIENCLLTVSAGKGFLKFETLTLFPIATDLIKMNLLTKDEVLWLNNYHRLVYQRLAPHLEKHEQEWLRVKCLDI